MMKTQIYKKGWAFTLTLVLVFTTLFGGFGSLGIKGVVEEAYAVPASTPTQYYAGAPAGTTEAPTTYAINTEVQLRGLATTVSSGSGIKYENTTFELTNNIIITDAWIPIGSYGKPFSGTFDGKNFEITGIQIGTSSAPDSTYFYVGLFGHTSGSAIKNLGVNVQINSSRQDASVGGLVGYNYKGTITNCYSTGDVAGGSKASVGGLVGYNYKGKITNCYSTSSVTGGNGSTEGYSTYVGGLVGWNNEGTINNCYATGGVIGGDSTNVGGLAGRSYNETITNCYATGNVTAGSIILTSPKVGGLVGYSYNETITNCYATGDVTGGSGAEIGGFVGFNQNSQISNGYWNDDAIHTISGAAVVNKLGVGEIFYGTGSTTSMTSIAMTGSGFVTTLNNWVSSSTYYTWKADSGSINGGYPLLDVEFYWTPIYTMTATPLIAFASQTVGYVTAPAVQVVTISNTGNSNITLTQPTATNYIIGEISSTTLLQGGSGTFTVQPKTGLAVGSYNETINITGSNSATTSVSVQFAVTTVSTHTMSASPLTSFASQTVGYGTAPASQTVTITNTGSEAITLTQPTSTNYTIGALSSTTLAVSGTVTFTVQPKTGLVVGSYTETINITGSNSAVASVSAQFGVTAAGGSGSSSGSSGSSGSSSTATTVIKTNTGSVTGAQLNKAADAAKDGETVTIKSEKSSEVNFPTSGLGSLTGKNNSLTVVTENGTLTFNSKAVDAMGTQATATDIKVIVDDVVKTTLTEDQQTKVGDKTVYDLSVMSGGKLISSFNGGKVNVSIPYELKTGETAENLTVWYMADDGSLTEINCTYDAKNKAVTFVVDHFSKYIIGYDELADWVNPFTDVKSSAWYYNAAAFVNGNGLMKGQTDTSFGPQTAMTRGMFVTILGRMEGIDSTTYTDKNTFSDVKSSQYYAQYIAWASDKGIVTGMGGDKFAPNAAVTREQMAVMMTNYMKFKGQGPKDEWAIPLTYGDLDKVSSWADEGVMFMTMKDLMKGMGNDTKGNSLFAPKATSTRAQTAQVMMNLGEILK